MPSRGSPNECEGYRYRARRHLPIPCVAAVLVPGARLAQLGAGVAPSRGGRMSGNKYVGTDAIVDAAKGRETDLLDALGIPWRSGKPHISCPYPEHLDEHPSWRWDKSKARAYCTCID